MTVAEAVDLREFLRQDPALGAGDVQSLERLLAGPQLQEARRELASLQAEIDATAKPSPDLLLRAGIVSHVLGQHERALTYLSRVSDSGAARFHEAQALVSLERFAEAEAKYGEAAKGGYDKVTCTLLKAGAVRRLGRLDEAESLLRGIAREAAARAEYSYQMGCILADRGDAFGAIEYFERAVDMDPHHSQALFRLAAEHSLRGNDADAIKLYERSLARPPHHLGSLLNLGLLYEDSENYGAAAYCFRRILDVDPTHERARLYLRDIEATDGMYYDEESAREQAQMEQLLKRPISDFELTVRSRNCLHGMGIYTLGDLTRVSEEELLAGKNFGETSLDEVREMLAAHELEVGQNLHQTRLPGFAPPAAPSGASPHEQAILARPISELNLSVRARKCMTRLGISTLGELVQKTPDELLGTRNFGVTSLNEIRGQLAEMGLKLRND